MAKRAIVAIDGCAAPDRRAIARRLAQRYPLPHPGAGLLYRATAAALISAGRDLTDKAAAARAPGLAELDREALGAREMGEAADG